MGAMANIEKAIRDSDLGVNPTNDGKILRCVLPRAHRGAPQGVHQARQGQGRGRPGRRPQHAPARQADTSSKLEKDGEVGKDDVTGAEKRLDGITKKHTDAIDELLKHKEAELLEV